MRPHFQNEEFKISEEDEKYEDVVGPWLAYHMRTKKAKSNLQRLADVNSFVLGLNEEKCMDHSYDSMIKQLKETSWNSEAGVGGRQWLYQTCTEFGWSV